MWEEPCSDNLRERLRRAITPDVRRLRKVGSTR